MLGVLLLLFTGLGAVLAAEKPNIILIYTDDQGVGDVSALNPEAKFQTPNLDRLIAEGMTFTDGHSSDTVCTPSRYGLLTGRYSWRTPLKKGVLGADVEDGLVEDGRMTLAGLLADHGYRTGMFGKWHLGMQFVGRPGKDRDWSAAFRDGPVDHGFHEFWGIPASMNYGVLSWLEGDRVTKAPTLWTSKKPGLVKYDPKSYRMTPPYETEPLDRPLGKALEVADDFDDVLALERFTSKTIEFIERNQKETFFAYVPLTSPHKPVIAAEEFVGTSDCGAYGDFMVETDYRVGQILEALDRLQIADHTLVIFTADNGAESTYIERVPIHGHDSSGVLRGGKRDLYEGGHRVPFLVRWPAVIEAGSVCDVPVCQTDFLATFAEMVGATLPDHAGEDSRSIRVTFQGEVPPEKALIHHSASGFFAVREGDWKLVLLKRGQELYNLADDVEEEHNVIDAHPEVVERLTKAITEMVETGRSTPGEPQENDQAWWPQLVWMPKPQ